MRPIDPVLRATRRDPNRTVVRSLARCVAVVAALGLVGPVVLSLDHLPLSSAQETAPAEPSKNQPVPVKPAADAQPLVRFVPIPLPITGTVDTDVMRILDRVVQELSSSTSPAGASGERPLVILDFHGAEAGTTEATAAEGSQFERSLALARYLAGEKLRQLRTVAFVRGVVVGHAVLPILACEELVLSPSAELGDAGSGETFLDATIRRGYSEIAERRRTLPTAVALGMLDPALAVFKIRTAEGVQFVTGEESEALQRRADVRSVETVKREGERGRFTGRDLRLKFGVAGHLAEDEKALAAVLHIPVRALSWDPSAAAAWRPLRVELDGTLTSRQLHWILRSLEQRVRGGDRNLVLFWINSSGGAPSDSLTLASFIAELPDSIRTVAIVEREARADAGLIALACDHLLMSDLAVVGGPGPTLNELDFLDAARQPLHSIAERQHGSWSPLLAMLDPALELFQYKRQETGEMRLLCSEEWAELPDRDAWTRGGVVSLRSGLTATQAKELDLLYGGVTSAAEVQELYRFEGNPDVISPTWAHMFVERLASPSIAALLLFIGCSAVVIEISSPQVTGAWFVSGLCFILYFWSQFLHGTAGWLEILLFVSGVFCVAIEVFVIPGFGIFGFGGGLLVITSLVLASQTFVIPRNAYELSQLPVSMLTVAAGGAGMMLTLFLVRRYLPRTPLFRRLMLDAPAREQLEERQRRESLADWMHLLGATGTTTTRLMPSGKAQFGAERVDVITSGEMIEQGAAVTVIECMGNRVVVRRTE